MYTLEDYVVCELMSKKTEIVNLEREIEKKDKEISVCHELLDELAKEAALCRSDYFGDYISFGCNISEKETPKLFHVIKRKIEEREFAEKEKGGD